MTTKRFAHGILGSDGDTYFLLTRDEMILLDVSFVIDNSMENKPASVIGTMGVPPGSNRTKLIADKVVSHDAIAQRAYENYQAEPQGSAEDNWFRAERELLNL
jgi:Protein of unknown function (DUF2934)